MVGSVSVLLGDPGRPKQRACQPQRDAEEHLGILLQFGRERQGYQSRRKASEQTWARARHGSEVRHTSSGPWALAKVRRHGLPYSRIMGLVGLVDGGESRCLECSIGQGRRRHE